MKKSNTTIHNGDLTVTVENQNSFKKLTEVSGSIYVHQGATLTAPALTKSGYIYVHQGATLTAPALTEVSGSIDVRQGATLNIHQTKNLEYRSVDNTLFVIEKEKTYKGIKIFTGYVITKILDGKAVKENCFVAEKEGFTAHGETVKSSIGDLQFKIVAEKLKNEPINKDTLITVKHYRLITGACNFGVRAWMESNNIPYTIDSNDETVAVNPIKASELWPLLSKSNAWGVDRFESLKSF